MRRPSPSLIAGLVGLALAIATGLTGCGDNAEPRPLPDGGPDAPPAAVGPCLDKPADLAKPPTSALPCNLLPPGFVAR